MLHPLPLDDDALLAECDVETFRAGGAGGQHQNVTESAVRLTHRPTGLVVTVRQERSQHQNKRLALEELRRRIQAANRPRKRRVPTAVPRAERRKRREAKATRSQVKANRRKPGHGDD